MFPEPLHHTAVRDLRLAISELDAARANAAERGIALDLDFIADSQRVSNRSFLFSPFGC